MITTERSGQLHKIRKKKGDGILPSFNQKGMKESITSKGISLLLL